MSYFSQKLSTLLAQQHLSQSDLANKAGISQAHISRLLSEDQRSVSLDDLASIAINITDDQRERADLLAAYLRDRCIGPGSELVHITVEGGSNHAVLQDRPAPPPLSAEMERVFELLRANLDKKNLRTALKGLADLMEDRPPNSARGVKVAGQIFRAAGVHARAAANGRRVPGKPAKYKIARRTNPVSKT